MWIIQRHFEFTLFFFSLHECQSSYSYFMPDSTLYFCFLSTPVCSEKQLPVPFYLNVDVLLFCGIKGICGNTWCSGAEECICVYFCFTSHNPLFTVPGGILEMTSISFKRVILCEGCLHLPANRGTIVTSLLF